MIFDNDSPIPFKIEDLRLQATSRRFRLWEIPGTVQCSIVGTCLDRQDVRVLMRRGRVRVQPGTTEYQIHGYFVQEATKAGTMAQLMQKALDKKYAPQVAKVGRIRDGEALREYWNGACGKGQVAGAYWGLLSHRHTPDDLRAAAFGDVHMLSHFMGGLNRGDARALWAAERRVAELEDRLERIRRKAEATIGERDDQVQSLADELQRMRALCIDRQPSPPQRVERSATLRRLERRREQQERRLASARARLRGAEAEIERLRAEIERLHELPVCPLPSARRDTPADLCPQIPSRLLYVGGRRSALPHLKNGAARKRAELLHHDGGIEHSMAQLHDLVAQADLVFCPVDCVSHGACLLARSLCRRSNKPFVPLRSASLSHFRRALDRWQPPPPNAQEECSCSSP